jgi:hypothetical protein
MQNDNEDSRSHRRNHQLHTSGTIVQNRAPSVEAVEAPPLVRNPRRYPGDGLDFRRPVPTLQSHASIVDLTTADDVVESETWQRTRPNLPTPSVRDIAREARRARIQQRSQRLPRFPDNIFEEVIDVDSLPDSESGSNVEDLTPIPDRPNPESPEVTFLHARPRLIPMPPPAAPQIPPPGHRLAAATRRYYQDMTVPPPAHHAPGIAPGFPMNMLAGWGPGNNNNPMLDLPGGYPVPQGRSGVHAVPRRRMIKAPIFRTYQTDTG